MTSCNGTPVSKAEDNIVSLKPQIAAMFLDKSDVIFIDPRPASAIASTTGIIPGAYNIELDEIREGNLPDALFDRSMHVITSCQAGPMAAQAARELAKIGFSRVNYIEVGTQAWIDSGYPTSR
ncbi:MAG: rhodanese-like domain-containing protein [Rhodospirillales bacterium]|nr:rhodanese-like domain-containing protein [Rhodospirillales bacterium]